MQLFPTEVYREDFPLEFRSDGLRKQLGGQVSVCSVSVVVAASTHADGKSAMLAELWVESEI